MMKLFPTKKMLWTIPLLLTVMALAVVAFINQTSFGRLPRGARLDRIERSPHYRDGKFQNLEETPVFTGGGKGYVRSMIDFLFQKQERLVPAQPIAALKTDLHALDRGQDLLVWFGHSSYLIQVEGKRLLVDPVFDQASPVSFFNKPFPGTDLYKAEDMPEVDYLIISHDHWDHLDYQTVVKLKDRVKKVICGLGVGEHFEFWGYPQEKILELDWDERADLGDGFDIHCLPARHFSGRGLVSGKSLWASFLFQSPSQKLYLGGDGGYGAHYADIGTRFPGIDLAILENGQYNDDWKYIHLMPTFLRKAVQDLNARAVLTVHHSKYALAKHPWDEPLENASRLAREEPSLDVLLPKIGTPVTWKADSRNP